MQGGDVRNYSKASSVQNGSNQERRASGDAKGGKQPPSKKKEFAPEQDLRRQLDMCSKHADVKRALELYDKFKADEKRFFNQYNYNIVLYLCSSAATNSLKPSKSGNERRGEEECPALLSQPFVRIFILICTLVITIEVVYVIMETLLRQKVAFC